MKSKIGQIGRMGLIAAGLALMAGCATNPPTPAPLPAKFIERPNPMDGATGVGLTNALAWSYVGQGLIPMPTADVLTNGALLGTGYLGTNAWPGTFQPGELVTWQVVAHTAAGIVTGPVWRFTTAFDPPPPPPVPTNAPPLTSSQPKGGMFTPQLSQKQPWIEVRYIAGKTDLCPDSMQDYARCKGKAWESDKRRYCANVLKAIGADTLWFYSDVLVSGGDAFQGFIVDKVGADGNHVPDAENSARWLVAAGVTNFGNIVYDSPDPINFGNQASYIKQLVGAYQGARNIHKLFLIGTECNRNMTPAQVHGTIVELHNNGVDDANIWVGSSSPAFLDAVLALDPGVGQWLEQASDPIMLCIPKLFHRSYRMPLTPDTLPAYKTSLQGLHGKRKAAGEFWISDLQQRYDFTKWCRDQGFMVSCGQYTLQTLGGAPVRHAMGLLRDAPGKHKLTYKPRLRAAVFPPAFSLQQLCPPDDDQGMLGSCTANGSEAAFDMARFRQAGNFMRPSRLKIYYDTRAMEGTVGQDAGAQIADVVTVLSTPKGGCCPETMWPYDVSQYQQKPSSECYTYGATNYVLQGQSVPQTLQDMKSVLVTEGAPIIIGMTVYAGDHGLESQACATDGLCGLPSAYDQLQPAGGHCVLVVGYDDSQRVPLPKHGIFDSQRFSTGAFLVRNSWGASWGLQGYFWIAYDYLLNPNFAQDFWALLRIYNASALPAPFAPAHPATAGPALSGAAPR